MKKHLGQKQRKETLEQRSQLVVPRVGILIDDGKTHFVVKAD